MCFAVDILRPSLATCMFFLLQFLSNTMLKCYLICPQSTMDVWSDRGKMESAKLSATSSLCLDRFLNLLSPVMLFTSKDFMSK